MATTITCDFCKETNQVDTKIPDYNLPQKDRWAKIKISLTNISYKQITRDICPTCASKLGLDTKDTATSLESLFRDIIAEEVQAYNEEN